MSLLYSVDIKNDLKDFLRNFRTSRDDQILSVTNLGMILINSSYFWTVRILLQTYANISYRKRKGMKDFTIPEDINSLNPIIIEKLAPSSMFWLEDEKVADLEKNLKAHEDSKEVSQVSNYTLISLKLLMKVSCLSL